MAGRPVIYFASPFGFSEVGKAFMYDRIFPLMKERGYGILDPWKLSDEDKIKAIFQLPTLEEQKAAWENMNGEIFRNNKEAIRICDGMVIVLDGDDPGSSWEMGFGHALNKYMIGYRSDFRNAGDNLGTQVNLMLSESAKEARLMIPEDKRPEQLDNIVQTYKAIPDALDAYFKNVA